MSTNPFGPLSAEEFQKAVDAPYGGAAGILQKHGPLWGKLPKEPGQTIKWRVTFRQEVEMRATVTVEAASEEEAEEVAGTTDFASLPWDRYDADDPETVDVVPE